MHYGKGQRLLVLGEEDMHFSKAALALLGNAGKRLVAITLPALDDLRASHGDRAMSALGRLKQAGARAFHGVDVRTLNTPSSCVSADKFDRVAVLHLGGGDKSSLDVPAIEAALLAARSLLTPDGIVHLFLPSGAKAEPWAGAVKNAGLKLEGSEPFALKDFLDAAAAAAAAARRGKPVPPGKNDTAATAAAAEVRRTLFVLGIDPVLAPLREGRIRFGDDEDESGGEPGDANEGQGGGEGGGEGEGEGDQEKKKKKKKEKKKEKKSKEDPVDPEDKGEKRKASADGDKDGEPSSKKSKKGKKSEESGGKSDEEEEEDEEGAAGESEETGADWGPEVTEVFCRVCEKVSPREYMEMHVTGKKHLKAVEQLELRGGRVPNPLFRKK